MREDEIAAFPAEVRSQLLSFFAVSSRTLELLSHRRATDRMMTKRRRLW